MAWLALLPDASEDFLFFERYAKLGIGFQKLGINLVQAFWSGHRFWRSIIIQILKINFRIVNVGPSWLFHVQPSTIRLQAPIQHPLWLAFFVGDKAHDIFIQALGRIVRLDIGFEAVFVFVDFNRFHEINGILVGHKLSCFQLVAF